MSWVNNIEENEYSPDDSLNINPQLTQVYKTNKR